MTSRASRRQFLKRTTAAGVGFWVTGRAAWSQSKSANEKLNIAAIGVGGKGESDIAAVAGENIVALCDIDEGTLAKAAAKYPRATLYNDFRIMLERQHEIDAVLVSTPDHIHAVASNMAMRMGKHVYCQKPLTHSIYEARVLIESAKNYKVATQMGNQGHSNEGSRRAVELIRSGVIGPVREVHAWTDRPTGWWPQGVDRPTGTPPVPDSIRWELFLGPAPWRPYNPAYHPFKWRGWWDFGTGALGDMACHVCDVAFWALELRAPTAIEAEGPPPHPESGPIWSIIRFQYPARGSMPPVKLTWYDGKKLPPAELFDGEKIVDNGSLVVGDKGKIYLPDAYGSRFTLLPKKQFADFKAPPPTLPNSPGHYVEWIQACKTGSPTGSNFEYAGALTGMVLLGNVAYRMGKRIEWDDAAMRAKNAPEADRIIRPEYRVGWSL